MSFNFTDIIWNFEESIIVCYTLLTPWKLSDAYIDGLVQDHSNSIANALELLQSCTEPLMCGCVNYTIIGSDDSFSLICWQAIIWTNAGYLSIRLRRKIHFN